MKNGKIPFGTKVLINGIPDSDTDAELNGLTGTLHRKFFTKDNPFRVFGEVGVWLDTPIEGARVVNVRRNEITKAERASEGQGGGR